ncbi:MAG: phosphate ABC transporter substrate-binding protein [Candidatus Zixiibacteriota bacterium]
MRRACSVAWVAMLLAGAVSAGAAVTIKGSDTMVILGQRWAEVYMRTHPGAVVQVTGGGSGTGIAALINGSADVAQSSRAISEKEKAELLDRRAVPAIEIPTAMDGIAIYVHKDNPVQRLTLHQLRMIYQGDITNWRQVGGADLEIALYSRENNSGTFAFFKERVLAKGEFSPECQMLQGTASIVNVVAKDRQAIGYGGIGYTKGVRTVALATDSSSEYYAATQDNVAAMKYPLSRNLYWYTAGSPAGPTRDLIDWVLGPEGQSIVTKVGYYRLPDSGHVGDRPDGDTTRSIR